MQPTTCVYRESVNLNEYPASVASLCLSENSEVTIGDLHGNALKLLYFLIKHQAITTCTKAQYATFKRIYYTVPHNLTAHDIEQFNELVSSFSGPSIGTVRLIGDELADRGANDYFTLKLIERISQLQKLEILFSNHSAEFIIQFYKKANRYQEIVLGEEQDDFQRSMVHLHTLIESELISEQQVDELVLKYYLPTVQLVTYSVDAAAKRLVIYTHAPCGINCIKKVAKFLGVTFKDTSINVFLESIDNINEAFYNQYFVQRKKQLARLIRRNPKSRASIDALAWSRLHNRNRPKNLDGFEVEYVHGHDVPKRKTKKMAHTHSLDNDLGKGPLVNTDPPSNQLQDLSAQGEYNVYFFSKD